VLNECFAWDKRHMDCFLKMLLGLLTLQTVNLKKLRILGGSGVKADSYYRRMQRFFLKGAGRLSRGSQANIFVISL
jgi:hypothetical protein